MITEITLGVPLTYEDQQRALDQGYELAPFAGHFRHRYVMGVRPLGPSCRITASIDAASEIFGFRQPALVGDGQSQLVFRARAAGQWAARQFGFSYPRIGRRYNRDATSVMHAVGRCAEMQSADPEYKAACERVMERVR